MPADVKDTVSELHKIAEDTLLKLQAIKDLKMEGPQADVVFAEVTDGVIIIDSTNTIVIANSKADEMFGYGPNELLGQPVLVLIPVKSRAAHMAKQHNYFQNPVPRLFRALDGLRRDGTLFSVDIALQPLGTISRRPLVMAILREKRFLPSASTQ
jgi:PAS domain S-box-containing protein